MDVLCVRYFPVMYHGPCAASSNGCRVFPHLLYFQLPRVSTGLILLGGLFFYDIFWVFGTDVMITVAKSFEAPIKLVFPQDILENGKLSSLYAQQQQFHYRKVGMNINVRSLFGSFFPGPLEANNFAMLGLGDIVIPGIFIALLLRFDLSRDTKKVGAKV